MKQTNGTEFLRRNNIKTGIIQLILFIWERITKLQKKERKKKKCVCENELIVQLIICVSIRLSI